MGDDDGADMMDDEEWHSADDGNDVSRQTVGSDKCGAGPLPWLWGRKWCLKGEVGRESLFLEPTLLLQREEQSFCMPVRASAGREDKTPGQRGRSGNNGVERKSEMAKNT